MADMSVAIKISALTEQAESAIKNLNASMKGTFDMAKSVGVGMTAFGAGMVGGAKWGIDATMQMEQYQARLKTALKDTTKVQETMRFIKQFEPTAPFSIDTIVDATVRLESYGLSAQKWLPMVGDLAGAQGKDVSQAVEAIADAVGGGGFERLKEFMINSSKLVEAGAKSAGQGSVAATTKDDLEKLKGALEAIMSRDYKGGMKDLMQTTAGAMSNFRTQVFSLRVAIGEALVPTIRVLAPAIGKVATWLSGIAKTDVGRKFLMFTTAAGALSLALGPLLIALPSIITSFKVLSALKLFGGTAELFKAVGAAIFGANDNLLRLKSTTDGVIASTTRLGTAWDGVKGSLAGLVRGLGVAAGAWGVYKGAQLAAQGAIAGNKFQMGGGIAMGAVGGALIGFGATGNPLVAALGGVTGAIYAWISAIKGRNSAQQEDALRGRAAQRTTKEIGPYEAQTTEEARSRWWQIFDVILQYERDRQARQDAIDKAQHDKWLRRSPTAIPLGDRAGTQLTPEEIAAIDKGAAGQAAERSRNAMEQALAEFRKGGEVQQQAAAAITNAGDDLSAAAKAQQEAAEKAEQTAEVQQDAASSLQSAAEKMLDAQKAGRSSGIYAREAQGFLSQAWLAYQGGNMGLAQRWMDRYNEMSKKSQELAIAATERGSEARIAAGEAAYSNVLAGRGSEQTLNINLNGTGGAIAQLRADPQAWSQFLQLLRMAMQEIAYNPAVR